MECRQVLGPLAGGDHLEPAGARPVDLLGDQRRLVAIGQAVDDTLRLRPPRQRRPAQHVGLDIDHDHVLAGLDRRQRVGGAGERIAGRLDHELDLGARHQRHRIVGQPGRRRYGGIGGRIGGGALRGPADRGQVRSRPVRGQIGDRRPSAGPGVVGTCARNMPANLPQPITPTRIGWPSACRRRSPRWRFMPAPSILAVTGARATCCRTATSPNCHCPVPVLSQDVHSVPACSAVTLVARALLGASMTILARANQLELRLTRDPVADRGGAAAALSRVLRRDGCGPDAGHAGQPDRLRPVRRGRPTIWSWSISSAAPQRQPCVVGCYRVLREVGGPRAGGGFYTAHEFDLGGVRCADGEIMELGRSCVEPEYRTGAVMQLLWRGIADYIDSHRRRPDAGLRQPARAPIPRRRPWS